MSTDNKEEKKEKEIVKIKYPDFDLEGYIALYSGHTKVARLMFIGDHVEGFFERAYKLVLTELKQTTNTKLYREVCKKVGESLGPEYKQDDEWILKTDKKISMDAEFLDTMLNNAKQSLDSKQIRDSHNKMGEHYYDRGELNSALKCYVRTRDYCTTPQHVIDMCLNVIKVNIEMNNFAHVLNYVGKAEQNPGEIDPITRGKLNVCAGLALLENKKYKDAARKFLHISKELSGNFTNVICERDIGLYACLCALAEFGREELKTNILENIDFKFYLDLVPQLQQVISDFYNSKYSTCLSTLDKIRGDFAVDLHLQPHVNKLYEKIRAKAIMQYFSPYSSVDINLMAQNFNTSSENLEKELANMIVADLIQARIDSQNKVLYSKQVDQRTATFVQAISTGNQFQQTMKDMLLKMNLIENEYIVKPNKKIQDDEHDD